MRQIGMAGIVQSQESAVCFHNHHLKTIKRILGASVNFWPSSSLWPNSERPPNPEF